MQAQANNKTFTVYMVNFDMMAKGTFNCAEKAIEQAKALGFECVIYSGSDFVCSVKPY